MTKIPRCFEGRTVVCIGGGPSLILDDVHACRGRVPVICVNDAYRMAPFGDVLYAADHAWWAEHVNTVKSCFTGSLWTQSVVAAEQFNLNRIILTNGVAGLSDDPYTIHNGGNSGFQALNMAYLMGAKTIVLLGYDMQRTRGEDHWFGRHPGNLNQGMDFEDWKNSFISAAAHLRLAGITLLNASRETALECMPRVTIGQALSMTWSFQQQ